VDIGLQDPNAREKSLGFIRLFLCISPHADERGQPESAVSQSIQVWNSVLTIHLLKGMNLPAMDDNGFSDPYCKFKLGRQKRRSKVVTRCLNPHWKEQFDLRMYHGDSTTLHIEVWDRDLLQSDDFIGETCVELHTLTQEQTHDLTLPLQGDSSGDCGSIHLLLTITGTTAQEVDRDSASANRSSWSATELKELMQKYMISRSLSFSLWNDIGHVSVIIDRLEGLGKSADVFVIAEVGNSQARTHTVYKTTAPFWGKAFHFDVRDVHSTLEVSVYSAKSKPELIGRTKVPLLRVCVCVHGYCPGWLVSVCADVVGVGSQQRICVEEQALFGGNSGCALFEV
jgi:Ca2+-dependent lipid-binding protein